ncbi:alpha/beta-hydrolase [Trametes gibbosa]|nr:alpha/beta-hydrolase [Trametes gibbosa]
MLLSTVTSLVASFLASFVHHRAPTTTTAGGHAPQAPLHFELRHTHAVSPDARVLFRDVRKSNADTFNVLTGEPSSYALQPRRVKAQRPRSLEAFHRARVRSMRFQQNEAIDWDEIELDGPDVNSRETLLLLAKMTNNAYLEPGEAGWYELGGEWNVVSAAGTFLLNKGRSRVRYAVVYDGAVLLDCYISSVRYIDRHLQSYPFGWEPDDDGFRGHVFATPDNSTVVLSIKGTSAAFIGGGGPTAKKDKFNDNLLFSCCCARVDWTWTTVCGCYRGGWKCDQNCLEEALVEESLFYPIGTNLYNNLTFLYPDSNIWMVGHSLGGALASLLGVTFGIPTVAIESPGEKMAAGRLHLPSPPELQHVTHLYHTADPIAMGTCNGVLSSCALGGYAMESKCHLGKSIVYDTVSNLSWAVDIRTHTIVNVIEKLLADPWPPSMEVGREVPEALPEDDCVECYSWDFGEYPPAKR